MSFMSFIDGWNDIIRDVIFPDESLNSLMLVPEGTNIIEYIDKYFIRAGYTNEVLTDENCRIIYGDIAPYNTDNPFVKDAMMTFDIYVKKTHLHDVDNDRLRFRTHCIAKRLQEILCNKDLRARTGFDFTPVGAYEQGTNATGYARFCVTFRYLKVM